MPRNVLKVPMLIVLSIYLLMLSQGLAQPAGAMLNVEKHISLEGQGIVYVEPDVAILDLGIQTSNPDVNEAISEANTIIDAVQATLADLGIEERHIRTGRFNIYPKQIYELRNHQRVLSEVIYDVSHVLTVTIEDITLVGTVLGEGLDKGANLSGSIYYTLSDPEEVENEARAKAVASIEKKLQQYVDLMGVNVGK